MEHVGIDVHENQSQICILTPEGELIEKRILTQRVRFAAVFGDRPRARILIEAATESEWVARCLEELGHEVIVADSNYAPMYGHRTRRVKTDRRDARALAEACRSGTYRPAHRTSDERRHLRGLLAVREALVRTRARYVSLIRTLLRREGLRVRGGNPAQFIERLREIDIPVLIAQEIEPLLKVLDCLDTRIALADRQLTELASEDDQIRRLCTVPGVGPVTAASVVATIDTAERFRGAHQAEAYLGLVPREMSSGEKQRKGRITKSGNSRSRWLLVEAAWVLLVRVKQARAQPLQLWAQRIAARRGKCVAVVALARRLAGILYAMMRDGTEFEAQRCGACT
jgi:transposase